MPADGLAQAAAGCLILGFTGTTASDDLRRAVAGGLGGVVLFTRNVADAEQVSALTAALHAERPDLLIAVDYEGGEFSHLSAADDRPPPSPRLLGELDDPELTRACARDAASTLAALGIDVMLAPSVDVNSNPANPIISTRSFGRTPDVVARHGVAFVAGVHDSGIAACAKHFPGHGDVSVDSHRALPRVDRWAEEIAAVELPPFRAVIEAGVDMVMSAHIVFSDYDTVPASLSSRLQIGLLREELGFDGVITTDALEMGAIAMPVGEAVVAAVRAGADLAMVAVAHADPAALTAVLVDAVGNDRLVEASDRVRRLGTELRRRVRVSSDSAAVLEAARRTVSRQDVPALGPSAYVIDLAQPEHPAWKPYFEGLPDLFGGAGVVFRAADDAALTAALEAAADRPLAVAVQDAVRTPWMADALRRILSVRRDAVTVVLCTGIPEDRALVPSTIPAVTTSGRHPLVLEAIANAVRLNGAL